MTHPFFRGLKNERLLAFFGQNFRPKYYESGVYLYRQGDNIMNFDIVTKGVGAFVQPRYHNQMFALVHPQIMDEEDTLDNYDGVVHV